MAPVGRMGAADHDVIEQQLKETVQSLYNILVQVSAYDQHTTVSSASTPLGGSGGGAVGNSNSHAAGSGSATPSSSSKPSAEVLSQELRTLSQSLQAIHQTASHPSPERSLPHIPPELVQYVENGRNPDIYTREFVEQVRRGNQLLRGKQVAFGHFRDALAGEMMNAMPELHNDIAMVLENTGGRDRWKDASSSNGVNGGSAGGGSFSGTTASGGAASATPGEHNNSTSNNTPAPSIS